MPSLRIVLTIRNQLDWIFSNYHHFVRLMPADGRSFGDFAHTVEGRAVLATGHFDRLVAQLHGVFGRANVLVLPLEETGREPEGALARLARFLGVAPVAFMPSEQDLNRGIGHLYGRDADTIEIAPTCAKAQPGHVPSVQALQREFGSLLDGIYAPSNVRLRSLVDFDPAALGYPV